MKLYEACQQLQQNDDPSLSLLNLSGQGIGSAGVTKLVDSCSSGYQVKKKNALLNPVSHCKNDDDVHASLPLVVLWLENNEIYSRGATSIKTLIEYSPHLKYLYMAHNHIGNVGIQILAPTIFQQLQVCNIADNDIGPIGAESIATCLSSSSSFTTETLILESNKLGDDGAISIAEGLRSNTTLQELDLRYNKIGIQGLTSIRDALISDNKTIQNILLEEEGDDDDDHHHEHDEDDDDTDEQSDSDNSSHHRPTKYIRVGGFHRHNQRGRCHQQQQRERSQPRMDCSCDRCKLRLEIEYYLALNRAGRHSFGNMTIHPGLWSRIFSRVSEEEEETSEAASAVASDEVGYDPSILYAMLCTRPDVLSREHQ